MTTTDEPAVEDGLPDLSDDAMLEAALEALLLVVDAPTEDDALAEALDQPVACAGSGRAGGSTPATPTPRSSSGCSSAASARS